MSATVLRTASFGQRVGGSFIDGMIFAIPSCTMFALGHGLPVWLTAVVTALYTIGLTAGSGQTLGKRVAGTRVVVDEAPTLAPPSLGACTIRWAVLAVPGLLPEPFGLLGAVVSLIATYGIVTDERARGIHDTLAGTRVIDVR